VLKATRESRIQVEKQFIEHQLTSIDETIKQKKEKQTKVSNASFPEYMKAIEAGKLEAEIHKLEESKKNLLVAQERTTTLDTDGTLIDTYPFITDTHTDVYMGKVFAHLKQSVVMRNWLSTEQQGVDETFRQELKEILDQKNSLTTEQKLKLETLYKSMRESLGTGNDANKVRQWTHNCVMSLGKGTECRMSSLKSDNKLLFEQSESRTNEIQRNMMLSGVSAMSYLSAAAAPPLGAFAVAASTAADVSYTVYTTWQETVRKAQGIQNAVSVFEKTVWGEYSGIAENIGMTPDEISAAQMEDTGKIHSAVLTALDAAKQIQITDYKIKSTLREWDPFVS
jgi:hypothetical protein